ncbi:MAG: ATP-binding protein [Deltaproteobacteria bacterium]|nr:ATP-binding protein [Deltaproteobacteria bacterium]MBW2256933.1 ATP-binding protein [Deltaproteobacteria bacterium]
MIPRRALTTVRTRLCASPAVAVVGPRQCGKTTLAQMLDGTYFDLEQEHERLRLDLDWDQVVGGDQLVVLDEAQTWPELFPRLRGAIDADRKRNGRFLLLGSVSPALMVHVSESLAGRLSLFELTPFLRNEIEENAQHHWFYGGYPDGGVLGRGAYPNWQLDYLALLAQRDLPEWGLPAKPRTTDRLFRMLAALHGQRWNASQVGASLGLSYHTVNSYLDYLEGAFLIRRLPSYQANVRKRLVKSPKVSWRDSGLLHALLNVHDRRALLAQPWVGASWECYVVEQVVGHLTAMGVRFEPYWFRTSDGLELDLVIELLGEVWAIEVKLTTSPSAGDFRRLDRCGDLIGATRRFLISRVSTPSGDGRRISANLESVLETVGEFAGG